ncbi:MAG TPA: hypothetical protein VLL97_15280 [Acidobacteriota bacterium]|nr:hypothetical protein [Acidobacteriota bacterium]
MTKSLDAAEVIERMEQLMTRLEDLSSRVADLEAGMAAVKAATAVSGVPKAEKPSAEPARRAGAPEITEDEIIAISAALGAYLGVQVRIKRIRLLSSRAWAQQGRAWIQASHNLH